MSQRPLLDTSVAPLWTDDVAPLPSDNLTPAGQALREAGAALAAAIRQGASPAVIAALRAAEDTAWQAAHRPHAPVQQRLFSPPVAVAGSTPAPPAPVTLPVPNRLAADPPPAEAAPIPTIQPAPTWAIDPRVAPNRCLVQGCGDYREMRGCCRRHFYAIRRAGLADTLLPAVGRRK